MSNGRHSNTITAKDFNDRVLGALYRRDWISDEEAKEYKSDPVNHPSHYTFGNYEVIDILMDWFKDDPLLWQVGKYIARAKHKGKELEDLQKAEFYLQKRIEILKGN